MEPDDFESLIGRIDRLIDASEPLRGEYLRGYREGIRLHRMAGRTLDNFRRYKSFGESGDPYLDNYIRGFTDGCKGVMPEALSGLLPAFRAS